MVWPYLWGNLGPPVSCGVSLNKTAKGAERLHLPTVDFDVVRVQIQN